jgi:RPA family protein
MAGFSAGFSREVAKRVFAEELKSSNYSFRDGEENNQYAPSYLLTPTGAKCNRVFVVGTLTEKDDIGSDTEYWRGRVVDPTGSILIYAGQYQPEAAQILAGMEPPEFVAVVGKPNLYQTEDGNIIISLRAESIQRVDRATQNQWVLDTAGRTLERLAALKSIKPVQVSGDFSTADAIPAQAQPQDEQRAMDHYHTDIEHFRQMVLRALVSLSAVIGAGETPGSPDMAAQASTSASINEGGLKERADGAIPPSQPVAPAEEAYTEGAPEKPGAAPRKARPRKSEPLKSWSEPDGEEDIETFDFGKKS